MSIPSLLSDPGKNTEPSGGARMLGLPLTLTSEKIITIFTWLRTWHLKVERAVRGSHSGREWGVKRFKAESRQPRFLLNHLLFSGPQPSPGPATTKAPSWLRVLKGSLASHPFSLHYQKGTASSAHKSLKCSGASCFCTQAAGVTPRWALSCTCGGGFTVGASASARTGTKKFPSHRTCNLTSFSEQR